MTKEREALKLALELLESAHVATDLVWERYDAITAIKEALKQPEQPEESLELFEYWNAVEGWVKIEEVRKHFDSVGCGTIYKTAGEGREPLYTTPPKQEARNFCQRCGKRTPDLTAVHTCTPPRGLENT